MSTRDKLRRAAGLLAVALILLVVATPQFRAFVSFPDHLRIAQGSAWEYAFQLPFAVTVESSVDQAFSVNGETLRSGSHRVGLGVPLSIAALNTGQYAMDFRLFGLIPFRRLTVDVVPPIRLIPGGHSIGVLLKSRGVIIVGHSTVHGANGDQHQPGIDAGLELGDVLIEVSGERILGEEHAVQLFEKRGEEGGPVQVTVKRGGRFIKRTITPVLEKESGRYKVGLYVRDGAAGVGTLTFYDPVSRKYGALGHVIADSSSSQPIDVDNGHIIEAEVSAIQKGQRGAPGEKNGMFKNEDQWLGNIEKNSRFGIFGTMHSPLENPYYVEPLPVALAGQVKEGPAEIMTVVAGQKLERYSIEILRVMRQPTAEGKNMIVKVTDPRLLSTTGGIVQGMSGSPIIQDGKIIGAVTHVFVNDPTRGYGVMIEWMLQEAEVLQSSEHRESRYPLTAAHAA